jgi:protein-tyrosine phosphatase
MGGLLHARAPHDQRLEIVTAGTIPVSEPTDPRTVRYLEAAGAPPIVHPPRRMTADDLASADLVIGMARHHIREAVTFQRAVFARSFTLRELVARAERQGPRREGTSLEEWVASLHQGRRLADLLADDPAVDLLDPYGENDRVFHRVASEIDALVDRFVAQAWPATTAAIHPDDQPLPPGVLDLERLSIVVEPAGATLLAAVEDVVRRWARLDAITVEVEGGIEAGRHAARAVSSDEAGLALCLCEVGAEAAIAANRSTAVRAVELTDATAARRTIPLVHPNVLCLSAHTMTPAVAADAVRSFLRQLAFSAGSTPEPGSAEATRRRFGSRTRSAAAGAAGTPGQR